MPFDQNLLRAKLVEKGVPVLKICRCIGVCETTFYRKMARNGDFSRFEIQRITEVLKLTLEERDRIFFAQ